VVGAGLRLHAHCAMGHKAGLEKNRFFLVFFCFFLNIFAPERKFLGFFSVSRILLGTSRLKLYSPILITILL